MEHKYIGKVNDFSFIKMMDILGYDDFPAPCDYCITFAWSSSCIYNTVTGEFVKLNFSSYGNYCFDLKTSSLYLFKRSVKTKHAEFTIYEYDISNGQLKNEFPLPKKIWYRKELHIDGLSMLKNGTFLVNYLTVGKEKLIPNQFIYNKETQEYSEINIPNKDNTLSPEPPQFVIGNDIYILAITNNEKDKNIVEKLLYKYSDNKLETVRYLDNSFDYQIFTDFDQNYLAFIMKKESLHHVLIISLSDNKHVFESTYDGRTEGGINNEISAPYFKFMFSKDNKNNILFTRQCEDKIEIYNLTNKKNYTIKYVYNGKKAFAKLMPNNKIFFDIPPIEEQIKGGGRKIMRTVCSFELPD